MKFEETLSHMQDQEVETKRSEFFTALRLANSDQDRVCSPLHSR